MEKPASRGPQSPTPSTTFVQADATTFRELVQRLTGAPASSEANMASTSALKVVGVKRPTSKLYERREYCRPKLEILRPDFQFKPDQPVQSPSKPGFLPVFTPPTTGFLTSPAVLSPSTPSFITSPLNTPSSYLSNLSILDRDEPDNSDLNKEEEEKAIKERRFYFHPSPRSRPGNVEPELLTLFPLTSPKNP
ncbi:VQ motif-containing protein 31-like [Tasmannia lanceolata]|uniref:VQ motif-containing protein 31-like n=1 Tax=Tasmannia lanceolata TaxID=3420 RepID=UPI004063CD3D